MPSSKSTLGISVCRLRDRTSLKSAYSRLTLRPWTSLVTRPSATALSRPKRNTSDPLLVRVRIDFTPTYNYVMRVKPTKDDKSQPNIAARLEDFWKDFRFPLTQNDEPLQYHNISGEPQFSLATAWSDGAFISDVLAGAYVNVDYDTRSLSSPKNW